ncbi:LLGL scribble cell polarity complex component 2-like isoform X5 [Watersipora subatra]|uniref:LLGL scribble cell polarity complex component 2-like isoform X5 n=1 Tax=Watersipora subatra TaxID=2589382 RepID=UPI00355C8F15
MSESDLTKDISMTSLISYFRHRYDKIKGDVVHSHPKESEIRQRLKKELYEYNQILFHGFPTKPTAIAHDPSLSLLAVGTKDGALRVYGASDVEFCAVHACRETVTQLLFIPGEGRIITLTCDNVLHLWEINSDDFTSTLVEKKLFEEFGTDGGKSTTISVIRHFGEKLLLGTEGGNVHIMLLSSFKLTENVIQQDVIMQNVPEDFKVNPGAVEALQPHPTSPDKVLIGYDRGLIVLWDVKESSAEASFNASQQLESLCWHRNGTEFLSSHADGSYSHWVIGEGPQPKEETTPYGPYPCKPISKIVWKTAEGEEEPFVIFTDGMERRNYADRFTVSVVQGPKHVTFDFTSRVLDFLVLSKADEEQADTDADLDSIRDVPHSLVVLLEEELVVIDLLSNGWPPHRLPYMNSVHASAITASSHVSNVPESLWRKILDAGNLQFSSYSKKDWPIKGGERREVRKTRDLLLTGHEDGSVKLWDISAVSMSLLYKVNTASYFEEGFSENAVDEDDWPPFRKIGNFDPYTDDPRLGVQRMFLCPVSDILVVAGTAGQVIVLQMEREQRELDVKLSKVNLVGDRDNFVWKGHESLTLVGGEVRYNQGFQPQCVLQMTPPAACTALSVHTEWQLLSAGTAHGFCLFDFCQRQAITATCTLSATETSATDDSSMSRRKSFKKSLRESFRRLRRRRSMSKTKKESGAANRLQEMKAGEETRAISSPRANAGRKLAPPSSIEEDMPHAERAIEERNVTGDGSQYSMVRCLHFADTYLTPTVHSPSLLAGTNAGKVYIFSIVLPAYDRRDQEDVTAKLSKEITLKHQAPVIGLAIVDGTYYPLPLALEVQNGRAKAPDMSGNHKLLVISEEQFKIFAMPTMKPEDKWKLTAHEGSRTRRVSTCTFRSRSDEQYNEMDIACVTNTGQLSVYTIKGLRRQMNIEALNRSDINGIASCLFASTGEGFFLASSSEFARFSLSAAKLVRPLCKLNLKDGLRTPEGTPQIIVENYVRPCQTLDETHPVNNRDSLASREVSMSGDQSFRSADMTQDEVIDYGHDERRGPASLTSLGSDEVNHCPTEVNEMAEQPSNPSSRLLQETSEQTPADQVDD